ncbi:MAG: extracellular solute-binding protein [Pseudomonadota bacterium]|nr:extracellular solute-binding protein [Pseudomonadota bacterium]
MRGGVCLLLALAVTSVGGCARHESGVIQVTLQRFFGACETQYGNSADVAAAEGECGIVTAIVNRFNAENPDVHVNTNVVYWPGYDQLSAALAAGEPPDLVSMHQSVISDYSQRHLIVPLDDGLRAVGITADLFTAAARAGVMRDGHIFALPFDTWAPLWHLNLNLFRKAGMLRSGVPLLPRDPDELLQQARRFTRATGKPYLIQSMVNDPSVYARNLFTFLMQQNSEFFPDPHHIRLRTPEAHRVLDLFKRIYDEDLTTKNQDYTAATAAFLNGQGGVYLVGTWMIGDYEQASKESDSPLFGGYEVVPFPQLYPGRDVTYADGHSWAVTDAKRSPEKTHAIYRVLQFLKENDFQWSRTGHLPAYQAVVDSAQWQALPHRKDLAKLDHIAAPLPTGVQRQFLIQQIISQEMQSAITGQKSIDVALGDAERRVNDLLFNLL